MSTDTGRNLNRDPKDISEHSPIQEGMAPRVGELPPPITRELSQLAVEVNQTEGEDESDLCVHQLFEKQVARTPDSLAVVFANQGLTYGELNARANQLAHLLRRRDVGANNRVGLCINRSARMIVGLLGILKAGGAYVPLNPEHPRARLELQLKESNAPILITASGAINRQLDFAGEIVDLDRDAALLDAEPVSNPRAVATRENLVYVIYTSGSTGVPKGVAVRHRSLVNYTQFIVRSLQLDRPLQFATVSTIAADLGNTCIFPSLVSGGCLHILGYDVSIEREQFRDYLAKRPIDVLKIVPSHLNALLTSEDDGQVLPLRYLILGGETLSWELMERISRAEHNCEVINHYGPTETTVGSLTYSVGARDAASLTVPIGGPIANTTVYIVDQYWNPVPVGIAGELYIGGAGLADGYLNQPAETAERFVPNPFSTTPGARLYQTGDLARYLPDGNIEFLGRVDHQVKLRGFRVDLGEIEVLLAKHRGVHQAIVVVRQDTINDQRLVAYVVVSDGKVPFQDDLRSFLKQALPDYMVPSAFVFLQSLPLTPNGKVDRRALPPPGEKRPEVGEVYLGPRNKIEEQLARIFELVLNLKSVGVRDDFFEFGGHSLLAVRLFAEIANCFGKRLPLATLFQAPTVEHLANILRNDSPTSWSSLVAIRTEGTRPPLYCLHACGPHVFIYQPLARHLAADQPVYGIQAQGLDGQRESSTSVPEMVTHYVREIREFQPEGPYYLLGDTLGGIFAFEMARQLHSQGQKVAFVGLIDTFCPLTPSFWRRILCHLVHVREMGPATYMSGAVKALKSRLSGRLANGARSIYAIDEMMDVVQERTASNDPIEKVEMAIFQAVFANYSPPREVYPGKITYFFARDAHYRIRWEDNRLDWGKLASEGLQLFVIPGEHNSIREEPSVAILADKLTASLRAAR
jgi:amino acid adenylation domain-containing protein